MKRPVFNLQHASTTEGHLPVSSVQYMKKLNN